MAAITNMAVSAFRGVILARKLIVIILTPLLFLPVIFIDSSNKAYRCAFSLVVVALYWVFEVADLAVVSLLPIVMYPTLGVLSAKQVSVLYFHDTIVLLLGSMILAVAIEHWGVHKRIALKGLMLMGVQPRRLLLGFIVITGILSMWINNTATTAMMLPIVEAVISFLKNNPPASADEEALVLKCTKALEFTDLTAVDNSTISPVLSTIGPGETKSDAVVIDLQDYPRTIQPINKDQSENFSKALLFSIAYASSIGGISTLTGTGTNVVFVGQLSSLFPNSEKMDFLKWMLFALPLSAILLVILWIYLQVVFLGPCSWRNGSKASDGNTTALKKLLQEQYSQLGPMKPGEIVVTCLFVLLVLLWVFKDPHVIPGWGNLFPDGMVSDATASIFVSLLLFLIPISFKSGEVKAVMPWKVCMKQLPWGVLLLLGGGFALAEGVKVSGLSNMLAHKLKVLQALPHSAICFLVMVTVTFLTEVTSNAATTNIFLPVLATLSRALRVHPFYLMIPATVSASYAFMLPVATPPNALIFSSGRLRIVDMIKVGFLLNFLGIATLSLALNTWGMALFSLNTFPAWAESAQNATGV